LKCGFLTGLVWQEEPSCLCTSLGKLWPATYTEISSLTEAIRRARQHFCQTAHMYVCTHHHIPLSNMNFVCMTVHLVLIFRAVCFLLVLFNRKEVSPELHWECKETVPTRQHDGCHNFALHVNIIGAIVVFFPRVIAHYIFSNS
jgi:hypothetical protein